MFRDVALQQMPEKLQQLCKILQQASVLITEEYHAYLQGEQFEVDKKQDSSPVTQADMNAHRYLREALAGLTIQLPLLSEEEDHPQRRSWAQYWLLDPLDGTKEFLHKTGEFTINLSLIDAGQSVISAIAVPLKNTIYISEKGDYPFRWQWDNENLAVAKFEHVYRDRAIMRIAVSRRAENHPLYTQFMQYLTTQHIPYEMVNIGSAYKFCMMLEDVVDIYPRFHPTCEWDTAAGQGLLESIGGELVDFKHQPFQYNQRESVLNQSFIALRQAQDWQYVADFFAQQA